MHCTVFVIQRLLILHCLAYWFLSGADEGSEGVCIVTYAACHVSSQS